MMTSILVGLAFLIASGGNSAGQKGGQFPSITQKDVYLNRGNDGQKVFAFVVTLQTIGGGHYGTPHLSSRAVRFAMDAPPTTAEPRQPEAGVPFHGRCRGRNPDSNSAHRLKSHGNVYDSGEQNHDALEGFSFRLRRRSGATRKLLNPTGPRVCKD